MFGLPQKIFLQVDHNARSIVVPGKNGRRVIVAIEDVSLALKDDSLEQAVQASIDSLDASIDNYLTSATSDDNDSSSNADDNGNKTSNACSDADFSESSPHSSTTSSTNAVTTTEKNPPKVTRGDRVKVYWPEDRQNYPGVVKTLHHDGQVTILYDDGETERLNMDNEDWDYEDQQSTVSASSGAIRESASTGDSSTEAPLVTDTEPIELKKLLEHFGNKSFLKHQAQGFEQYVIVNAYNAEEENFIKTVKVVSKSDVPEGANVASSHVLYKVKHKDDGSLKLKARIAPHGNEDDMRRILSKDCTTCPPTGLRIVESIASLKGWKIKKADVKAAFLQTGAATRDVYVKPPRECGMKSTHMWLLLTAAHGLVNANAKWQVQSDELLFDLGLKQCQQVQQLFYRRKNGELVLIVAKIVDDIKVSGEVDFVVQFMKRFNSKFKFGTVASGPGRMRFFGINIEQAEDFTIHTEADEKLNALTEFYLSRPRRKEHKSYLNDIERSFFASTNSSLGWIGTAASPLCSFYASYLQQKAPDTTISDLVEQLNIVRKLKRLGTAISYPRPTDKRDYELSILVFADASKPREHGQIGVLAGLLVGELESGSIFHSLSWISHKSKRPVKSVPAAEILAAGEAIDEAKSIAHAYRQLLGVKIGVQLCVDSKDLFRSMSSQRNSIDRSIRADVACIIFEFQVGGVDKITWIPGKINLADVLTKTNSPLTDSLQLTLFTGRLKIDFQKESETKFADKNYG